MIDLSKYVLKYELVKLQESGGQVSDVLCTPEPVSIDKLVLESEKGFTIGRASASRKPDLVVTEKDKYTSTHQGHIFYSGGRMYYTDTSGLLNTAGLRDNLGDADICQLNIRRELFPGEIALNNQAYIAFGMNDSKVPLVNILKIPDYLGMLPFKMRRIPRHVLKLRLEPKQ